MKRLILLATAAALLLSSCFGNAEPEPSASPSPSPSADPDEPVLTSKPVELLVWEDGGEEFIRQAAAKFNQKYPNITVRCVTVTAEEAANRLRTEAPAGSGPDLAALSHTDVRVLAEELFILPSRNQEKTKGLLIDTCADAVTLGGVLYGYPVAAETYALYYNKALVGEDEVPVTWDQMIAFIKAFDAGNKTAFLMEAGNAYYAFLFTTMGKNLLFGAGGDNPQTVNINSAAAVSGMGVFKNLRGAMGIPPEELTSDAVTDAFSGGDCAMIISGSWNASVFKTAGVDFGVSLLPALSEGDQAATALSEVRCMAVSAYSEQPDEASAFADFLLTEEMQILRAGLTGTIPSTDFIIKDQTVFQLMRQMFYSFPIPSIPEMDRFWPAFGAASVNIWNGAGVEGELNECASAIRAQP